MGTACAMSVLATGMMNPMPIPVTARKKPSPHTFVIIYCMIKVSPTKRSPLSKAAAEKRAVTAPVEREQSARAAGKKYNDAYNRGDNLRPAAEHVLDVKREYGINTGDAEITEELDPHHKTHAGMAAKYFNSCQVEDFSPDAPCDGFPA